jgi:hypothetical protein
MQINELNKMLVAELPELSEKYHQETSWQEGDDTGSHVVYGDVLAPAIEMQIEKGDLESAQQYLDFVEKVLELDDDYATNVITVSVLEFLFGGDADHPIIESLLGEKSLEIWKDFSK